nr:integrase, catalytic region, zinc finger, CCHC-type, peptidase aspartic, catalytic [Tanacetum cinerariifolium]
MLLCKKAEQYDWLAYTDEEIDEQELEAHYNYMAKIQEVPTIDSGTDSEPLEHVQIDTGYNVFANDLQHSKQSESIRNTCIDETDDSNVIPGSPDMCDDDISNDQNDVECDDERVALANLIANLKLDVDENKKIQKQLKKANTTLAHELKESKTILAETSKTLGESNSVRDRFLVALQNKQTEFKKYKAFNNCTIDYDKLKCKLNETLGQLAQKDIKIKEGLVKHKTKVIMDLKLKEEHDIGKMLSMEKQLKFLNKIDYKRNQSIQTIHMMAPKVPTYNDRPTFANPTYLKQAQSEMPCLYAFPYDQSTHANRLILDGEETLALERESRSKLNKDSYLGTVHFSNDQFALILGYGYLVQGNITVNRIYYVEGVNHNLFSVGHFCDADLEVALRKSTCFVGDLQGNNLLTGNRGSDLYTISLQESTSSTPLYLMDKASPTQAWLWHQRLSHLNFDYINLLLKKDVVIGLPKLKYASFLNDKRCQIMTTLTPSPNYKDSHVPSQQELDLLFGPLYDEFFTVSNSSVNKSSSPTNNSNLQDTQPTTNIQPTSEPSTPTYVHAEENNDNQAEEKHLLEDENNDNQAEEIHRYKKLVSLPCTTLPVQTRRQLATDHEMYMFVLTVSTAEPKNIKEAMADSAWIEAMHEELHQFDRLQVWELVDKPFGKTVIRLKWLWKNKKDEVQTVIRNKAGLLEKGETPKVLLLAWEKLFEIQHDQPEDIYKLLRKLLEDLQIINEELVEYINSPSWNCPTFYDDDDDEYSIQYMENLENSSNAITPNLPTEDPDNSLSMGDEHLSTILETESDEIIKSSVENLIPIPSESEGIFDDTCDVSFCDNSPPLDVLTGHVELFFEFNDNCTSSDDDYFEDIDYVDASPPDYELISLVESPSPFPIPVEDSDSFFEKSDTSLSYLDNSLPEFKTFSDHMEETSSGSTTTHADNYLLEYDSFLFEIEPDQGELTSVVMEDIFGEPHVHNVGNTTTHSDISLPDYEAFSFYDDHIEEISSGSTTTHSDISLSEYDSFIFDLSNDQFPPTDRSDFTHEEFADELTHIISPPEYDCFLFKVEPNSRDFTMDVVEDISPKKEPQVHNALPTHPTLQLNMKFQPSSEYLFTYVVWIFLSFLVYSVAPHYLLSLRNEDTFSRPDISHRCGTFPRFKVLPESPMDIFSSTCSPMDK